MGYNSKIVVFAPVNMSEIWTILQAAEMFVIRLGFCFIPLAIEKLITLLFLEAVYRKTFS
jgi:hypothetical protein